MKKENLTKRQITQRKADAKRVRIKVQLNKNEQKLMFEKFGKKLRADEVKGILLKGVCHKRGTVYSSNLQDLLERLKEVGKQLNSETIWANANKKATDVETLKWFQTELNEIFSKIKEETKKIINSKE